MVTLKSIDNVNMLVICDDSDISKQIKEHFSFYARNYRHMPSYKFGTWDGKISMYNQMTSIMYKGLLFELIQYFEKHDIEYKFDNIKDFKTTLKYDNEWIEKCFINMGRFQPKDYQVEYFKQAITHNKTLCLSPTGSGKSYIIYMLVRYIIDKTDWRILINVPSISLCEQLLSDFNEYCIDDWNIKEDVSLVYSTATNVNEDARVVISTWQSTSLKDPSYIQQFGAYVCDEAHTASADNLTKIINCLVDTPLRVGLSGTLDGSELHRLEMIGRFGKIVNVVTTAELIKRGELADVRIDCLVLEYDDVVRKTMTKKSVEYKDEIEYIINNMNRNKLIRNLVLKDYDKNTLLLFNNVDTHGKVMYLDILTKADENLKKVHMVHGKIDGETRESIRKEVDSITPQWKDIYIGDKFIRVRSDDVLFKLNVGDLVKQTEIDDLLLRSGVYTNVEGQFSGVVTKVDLKHGSHLIIASYGTFAVGINIKNLHKLVFAHPLKKQIRLLQSIGRLLRTCKGKETVLVIDIVDDMCLKTKIPKQNYAYKHYVERLKVYESTELPYEIRHIKFNQVKPSA